MATTKSFWSQLRPASWRGFSFVVDGAVSSFGRRNAVHEYPFRDTPWVEDLGRQAKTFEVRGFIHGDDVIAQRDQLMLLADQAGDGELVLPTMGTRRVALMNVRAIERKDRGRYFELHFTFMQQGAQIYPSASAVSSAATSTAAASASAAVVSTYQKKVAAPLKAGPSVLSKISETTKKAMASLEEFGKRIGLQPGQLTAAVSATALAVITGRKNKALQTLALQGLAAATSDLDGSTVGKYARAAIQSLAATALATGKVTPAAVRSVLGVAVQGILAESAPVASSAAYPTGAAVSIAGEATKTLFRRAAVIAATQMAASYEPASSTDAVSVRDQLAEALEREIVSAGDQGDDEAFRALKALRAAMVADLNARAARLPALVSVSTGVPVSSLVLANKLYGDASRADELVAEAAPIHPAFMPTSFKVLSS